MNYVVSGYIGFDNFGDELIAHVLTQKLKQNGAENITLISSNPEKTARIHDVDSCGMFKFIRPLMCADVLISGGGSLLQDVTSLKSLIYYLCVIYTALILGKKVEIFAQGIGPINSKIGILLTKFALKRADKITVRDENSQNLLKEWGIDSELVSDPAFDIKLPHLNAKGIIGIQLRSFKGVNDQFLEALADEVVKRFLDKQIEVISLQASVDSVVCNKFAEKLTSKGIQNVNVIKNGSVTEIIHTISSLEYLIAMRFHANVIGIQSGVKTLAINYDPKVKSLADEYNMPIIELNSTDFSKEFDKMLFGNN